MRTYQAGTGKDADRFAYWYPLQEWGIARERCMDIIAAAGLPVPPKSSCFFCPAMKPAEIVALREEHPELHARALDMEARAMNGKHGFRTVKGLGRRFAWRDLETDPPPPPGAAPRDGSSSPLRYEDSMATTKTTKRGGGVRGARKGPRAAAPRKLVAFGSVSGTSLIRWLRDHGFGFRQAEAALANLKLKPSKFTIRTQLGKQAKGPIPQLTAAQAARLLKFKKAS